jgi:hypothetical protein
MQGDTIRTKATIRHGQPRRSASGRASSRVNIAGASRFAVAPAISQARFFVRHTAR